jgi:catechol 2,3-dioxygenase-like lactoylglutathione lyase family enzyme
MIGKKEVGMDKIVGLNHVQVTIPSGVEDVGRAFYVGLLGLEEVAKPASLVGRGGFWVALGVGVSLHVGVEDGVDRFKTKAHVAFEVRDLGYWRRRVGNAGISIKNSTPIPGYNRFEIRDPFGNRLEFIAAIE